MILTFASQQRYQELVGDPSAGPGWTREDWAALADFMGAFNQELERSGELVETRGLSAPVHSRRVRLRGGVPVVTDGPYAEAEEVLAGYWIVECESLDRATEIAGRLAECPGPEHVRVLGSDAEYVTSVDGFANVAAERRMGRVPVLLVRMNADLVMGEELKKTGAGNLFTVFGEPDIDIKAEGDELRVILWGVDVYDPNTGQVRSDDTDQVALWMIDTAYNEESFFVRHCYFTGDQDPYARLKRALRADIDPEAWESLCSTQSRPFPRPETGKIAVKVINDYGDEVTKVFSV